MQRWIGFGVLSVVLALGGISVAYKIYQGNRPQAMWVPMEINPETPIAKRNEIAKELKEQLSQPQVLIQVSKDLSLPDAFQVSNDEQAANELSKRMFVVVGEADSALGTKVPSINIGFTGKAKERELSGKIATRMAQDVWRIIGIKPPPQN